MKNVLRTASIALLCVLLASCGSKQAQMMDGQSRQISGGEQPGWVDDPQSALGKKDTEHKAYSGMSRQYAMEQQARTDARMDAYKQAIDDMGMYGKRKILQVLSEVGVTTDIVNQGVVQDEMTKMKSEGGVLGEVSKWHIERWEMLKSGQMKTYYVARCLFKMPRAAAKEFMENVLKRHADAAEAEKERANIHRALEKMKDMDAQDW
jgi:hypothetical protein